MIRPAKVVEIPQILELTRACGREMCARGIFQWTETYPSREAFQQDIDRGELWVLDLGQGPVGTLVLSEVMDEEYRQVLWLTPNDRNRYVHRLGVHPDLQGRGYARKLMDFAEARAAAEGAASIRLDTFSRNPRNQRFYEQRGYQRLGAVYFPKQSAYPFYCYERILSSPA
ncbi:GNAT family N-acetyltransferase [Robiginitalea sp. SC105]|uniref:GNAT family N-acetyltransferase n=1 Tax=Robiginitalea sp. SC105 TaxID=2762332 RepID=UPI00163978E3|nr:GNAT family N-acetyltransferase [Robiginitalea sp. SC105]MBC2838077.1 GNAT family N-acetyltransferase [Robiginitalea sp. SC105]